ncbi:MAG: ferritin-like domain-containing protein [Clostridiales bacterium]|jgi:rubrerythrin|nr:ferritin-like domain-containing protein [Clostridiales bacterium]
MDLYSKKRLTPPNQKVLEILQSAWEGERESEECFHKLSKLAKDPSDQEILRLICMDECKHAKYFAGIYKRLTGRIMPPNSRPPRRPLCWELYVECEKMIHRCIDNVEFYRRIYFGFSDNDIRDTLFEIISDETNIAVKMTHMCNKNRTLF